MQVSTERGFGFEELTFCRQNQQLAECREILARWSDFRKNRDPNAMIPAITEFRRLHGTPCRRLDQLYCYMTALSDRGIEDIMMIDTEDRTIVLSGADPVIMFSIQPLIHRVRQQGIVLTLRLYVRQPDEEINPILEQANGIPQNLYVFVSRKPDGHERSAAFIDTRTGKAQPMMTFYPEQVDLMQGFAETFRQQQGMDIHLHRYVLECDVDERELLSRC